jgi:hypothetical protein
VRKGVPVKKRSCSEAWAVLSKDVFTFKPKSAVFAKLETM